AVWNGQELVLAQRDIGPLELRHGRRSLGSAPPPGSEPIHHLVGYGCGAPGALAGGAQIATWSLTADDGLVDGPGGSQPRTSGEEVHLYVMTFRVDAGSVEQVEEFGEHFSTVGEALARVAELGIDDRCRRYITAPGDCPGGQPLRPDPSLPP